MPNDDYTDDESVPNINIYSSGKCNEFMSV